MIQYIKHIKLGKFITRVTAAWRIITGKYNHWVLVNVDEENFIKVIKEEEFDCNFIYSGTLPYIYFLMLKKVSASKDDIDMALDKAQFEADASEYKRKL